MQELVASILSEIGHLTHGRVFNLLLFHLFRLIFGNPKVGTPLMLCSQLAALDLPQKALAYKDESGQVWLAYNDPVYMAKRHNTKDCDAAVQKVTNALANATRLRQPPDNDDMGLSRGNDKRLNTSSIFCW